MNRRLDEQKTCVQVTAGSLVADHSGRSTWQDFTARWRGGEESQHPQTSLNSLPHTPSIRIFLGVEILIFKGAKRRPIGELG